MYSISMMKWKWKELLVEYFEYTTQKEKEELSDRI